MFFIRERIVLANVAKIKQSRTKDGYSRSGKLFAEAKGQGYEFPRSYSLWRGPRELLCLLPKYP